jgi:arylsulfatase A-like enzyme
MIRRRSFVGGVGATTVTFGTILQPADARERVQRRRARANVLMILADDLGFADLGCYGGDIATPAIDRLARLGTRYTNFRTVAVCAATRASLLTGLNPHSAGIGLLTDEDRGFPGYRRDLTRQNRTTAELLHAHGYSTFHVGKWHLNHVSSSGEEGPGHTWPLQRGFEKAYWFQGHSSDYFDPAELFDGNSPVERDHTDAYYLTDDLTDRAIAWLEEHHRRPDSPWYLYLAYDAPHSPLQVRPADRDFFRGKFDHGWDMVRKQRLERQKKLGLMPATAELPPRNPEVPAWTGLTERQRRIYARYMEVYAGVVHRLDWNVGRVLECLSRMGVADDTLVIFASDNGGSAEGAGTGTPNLLAGITQEIPEATVASMLDRMGERGTFPHYPTGWAMASNTPFKMYKQMTELGGVADPMIVKWPAGQGHSGSIRREFVHVADIHPTILETAGLANEASGKCPVEGVSFAPGAARFGRSQSRSQFEIRGRRAMYRDGWRLVANHQPGTSFESDHWRLYDLSADFNEIHDVAKAHPGLVVALKSEWNEAARRFDVLPLDSRSPLEKARNGPWLRPQKPHWELRPGSRRLAADVSPAPPGRSHRISIMINRRTASEEGVLLSYGNMYFGWVIYIQDGRLIYELSNTPFGLRIVGDREVPVGRSEVRYEQEMRKRPFEGTGRLFIGPDQVAEFELPGFAFGVVYQGLELGRNGACPVSTRYAAPFPFQGTIKVATIDYDVSPYSAEELAAITARTRLRLYP